ncbi:MAG: hypothetical protein CMJ81_23250 [Planctomycetaceae bacterium]|nr:hypothetical protein [Planctomycetaceae bacterium]MBP61856.1 hypothetical protein [Planctomycetaceae bacterium]
MVLPLHRAFRHLVFLLLSYWYGRPARINDRSCSQDDPGEIQDGAETAGSPPSCRRPEWWPVELFRSFGRIGFRKPGKNLFQFFSSVKF